MKPLPADMLAPGSLSNPGATTNTAAPSSYAPPGDLAGATFTGHAPNATPYGDFVPPSASNFEHSPDFQYLLDQQAKARQRSAAARGTLLNTGTVAGLQRDAAGIAAGDYQNAFNRALAAYSANKDTNAQNFGQSTTQFRGDLDIFGANGGRGAGVQMSTPGTVGLGPQVGSTSALSYGPTLSDFASSVAAQRQTNAATANMRPGWTDRPLGPPSWTGASTGGGIGRRAFR